jgi:hypothetical protein
MAGKVGKREKERAEKKNSLVGSMLTYDTALQVIAWTPQKDLLLHNSFLGRHLAGFLLLAGVTPGGEEKERGRRSDAGTAAMRLETRGESRTSCGSF